MINELETSPISRDKRATEVNGIYDDLVMVEAECIDDLWQALSGLLTHDSQEAIIWLLTDDSQQATQRPSAAAGQSEIDLETAIANRLIYQSMIRVIFRARVASKAQDSTSHVAD
jgi:hypothetical protein